MLWLYRKQRSCSKLSSLKWFEICSHWCSCSWLKTSDPADTFRLPLWFCTPCWASWLLAYVCTYMLLCGSRCLWTRWYHRDISWGLPCTPWADLQVRTYRPVHNLLSKPTVDKHKDSGMHTHTQYFILIHVLPVFTDCTQTRVRMKESRRTHDFNSNSSSIALYYYSSVCIVLIFSVALIKKCRAIKANLHSPTPRKSRKNNQSQY